MRTSFLAAAIIVSTGVAAHAHSPYTTAGMGGTYAQEFQGNDGYDGGSRGFYHRRHHGFGGYHHAWRSSRHNYASGPMGYGGYDRHHRYGVSAGYGEYRGAPDWQSGLDSGEQGLPVISGIAAGVAGAVDATLVGGFDGGGWSAGEQSWHSGCGCNSGWNF